MKRMGGWLIVLVWMAATVWGAAKPKRPAGPVALPPVFFCGEMVPTEQQRVARRLVTTLVRHAEESRVLYRLRYRASTFFPAIEPILHQYGIPADFKYLPLVESSLRSRAVSPRGAAGYWQLMPATARELGLSVRPGRDERTDLRKSTDAACRYLRYLHNQLGSWTLVAAAYNIGIGNLLRHIRRQDESDYYALRLNTETGYYLYRIIAFKELFTNSRSYGDLISPRAMLALNDPLPGEVESDPVEEPLLADAVADEIIRTTGTGTLSVRNLPKSTQEKLAEVHNEQLASLLRGGVQAQLVQSAGLERGQTWVFRLLRDTGGALALKEGDLLYAVVEATDLRQNKFYLRVERAYSVDEKTLRPALLMAIDVSTGRSGIPIPDLNALEAGWVLTWKSL